MAEKIAFAITDALGVPLTGATPSFLVYKNKAGGALSAPAITHLGGGVYGFQPSDADVAAGVAYLISTGGFPERVGGAVYLESAPFAVALLIDGSGALWGGAAPTVGLYVDFAGAARTAPALVALNGTNLYALVPSLSDLVVGSAYRIDAPATAIPQYTSGSFFPPAGPAPAPLTGLEAIEGAIQGETKDALAFDDGHVIWANQNRDRPSRPFVELAILDSDERSEFAEEEISDTPGSPAGQEVTISTKENNDLTVQFRVFSSAVTGSAKALNLARKIRRHFGLGSTTETLGDVAIVARGSVRDATVVLETEHEGRAVLDVRFRVADTEVETVTNIQTATVKTTIAQSGGDVIHDLTITA